MSQSFAEDRYLVTVPLAESIPDRGEVICLGGWCVEGPGPNGDTGGEPRKVLSYPWMDNGAVREGIAYTEEVFNSTLPKLADWLNLVHGQNNNEIYWKRVIGYFLKIYIQTLYEKYRCLKIAIETNAGVSVVTLSNDFFRTCATPMHFIENIRYSDGFNWQLYSQISSFLGVDRLEVEAPVRDFRELTNGSGRKSLKDFRHWIISKATNRGLSAEAAFYVTLFDQASMLKLTAMTGFRAWPVTSIDFSWAAKSDLDLERRESLARLNGMDDFSTMVLRTLSQNLPTAFLEEYARVTAFARKRADHKIPKAIFTGIGFLWNPVFAVWAAECASKGCKVFGIQHGGTYGEVEYSYGESIERDTVDKYISWGWREGSRVEPLPSPHLARIKPVKAPPEDRILLVSTLDSRYAYFLSTLPFSARFLRHLENLEAFLSDLEPEILERIHFRPYPDDFGWQVRERLLGRFPGLGFDDGRNFRDSARRSRLVVFDHLGGTTFLESLSLEVPLLSFGDPGLFSIRQEAQKYHEALQRNGVLHPSPAGAASVLNANSHRIEKWWSDPSRQEAITNFRSRFAWKEKNSIRLWADFVKAQISGGAR